MRNLRNPKPQQPLRILHWAIWTLSGHGRILNPPIGGLSKSSSHAGGPEPLTNRQTTSKPQGSYSFDYSSDRDGKQIRLAWRQHRDLYFLWARKLRGSGPGLGALRVYAKDVV